MKVSSKNWQVSAILSFACILVLPFNVIELYVHLIFGIELYTYVMATPAAVVSFLFVQAALAIALYRKIWTRTHSTFLSIWLINISLIAAPIWRTLPGQ
ncbi:hypothetical protein [Pseudomonas gingeri]|uniref:Uncharacterized protein n=1 Tax=Pseudomonas gingeri TaxID=117681 RepID=A0A7Y8CIX8_9PSED|nr:hypothetical protein [Pseudomonas gingeri]NWB29759.1 hypothetical protein [Pseudomonas gingeri]NWC31895.1 hypothetical protein [Pseudomonas gingeri]NWD08923.1 hypothetical protein [Pseudomonas gingeri]NWD48625.1 hypothetical protein [Pseudomonas gingeri]NWE36199.1 hypothetical protein [Pseudomonas gingeri]